jgi:hypothetical protein
MRLAMWQKLQHDMRVEIQQARRVSGLLARKLTHKSATNPNSTLERVVLQHYGGRRAPP